MPDANDMDLVRDFARENSEAAFAELVQRHINLVYSVALRRTGSPADAQDVTQAVFIILAQKTAGLHERTVLTGWLYETTRFTSAKFLRTKARRAAREQEAFMQSTLNQPDTEGVWRLLAPHLEDAMGRLAERDRTLLALRFYENKTGAEAAAALGIGEDAAHKRTARALEKLRTFFSKRGVALSATAIAGAVSTSSVQAAPVGLAKTISAVAFTKGAAAGGSTLALVKGALKLMAWTKTQTIIAVSVGVLLAAGTTTVVVKEVAPKSGETDKYFLEIGRTWANLKKLPPYFIVRPTHFEKLALNGTSATGDKDRAIGRAMDFKTTLGYAYDFHNQTRTIFPENLPTGQFDFFVSVPGALEKFQAEIKKQFGYAAHKENRSVDALVLKVKTSNAPGLKRSAGTGSNQFIRRSSGRFGDWPNFMIQDLAGQLESSLEQPVVDKTGLHGFYDVKMDWQYGSTDAAKAELRQAVLDQLGLELVSTNMPIEMLVVEKVN